MINTDIEIGVFAGAKRIPKGSYIGIYAGEILTEQEGEDRGQYVILFIPPHWLTSLQPVQFLWSYLSIFDRFSPPQNWTRR